MYMYKERYAWTDNLHEISVFCQNKDELSNLFALC